MSALLQALLMAKQQGPSSGSEPPTPTEAMQPPDAVASSTQDQKSEAMDDFEPQDHRQEEDDGSGASELEDEAAREEARPSNQQGRDFTAWLGGASSSSSPLLVDEVSSFPKCICFFLLIMCGSFFPAYLIARFYSLA